MSSKSLDGFACATDYDTEMVTPHHLMGINYPASLQVREDLQSTDNRPARRRQFRQLLPGVTDLESAKPVIVHTDPANPLSIFGRWDLGYGDTCSGDTCYPKQIPDGAVDAKAADTAMVRSFMQLTGRLDLQSAATGAWMLYGTARVHDEPFIWSSSSWKWQKPWLRRQPQVRRLARVATERPPQASRRASCSDPQVSTVKAFQ